MKTFVTAALLALPLGALGLQVTSPTTGETWNNSGVHTITWVTEPTDPAFVGIYLANNVVVPPQMVDIIANISSHAQSFTFETILPNGTNYQIQFNSVGNISESGVLAVSGKFTIVNGGPEPGTEATPASETSTGGSTTATGSAGGNSPTGSSGATGTTAAASATGSGSSSTSTGKSSGHATYGSRGFAIALGMIGVGFAAMFITA